MDYLIWISYCEKAPTGMIPISDLGVKPRIKEDISNRPQNEDRHKTIQYAFIKRNEYPHTQHKECKRDFNGLNHYVLLRISKINLMCNNVKLLHQFQIVNLLFHRQLRNKNARWHIHLYDTRHGAFCI